MPTTIEDRLVVGDATVVADLYRQHGALIHTISQQLVDAAADRLTQQIFVEAWQDRLDFNPSMGSVRNWLIRRVRERVSSIPDGADAAVDRIVVADSLAHMDGVRRQVLSAGVGASNTEELAAELDLPVASVKGHLRRGMDSLKADLADSRSDGSDAALADIMAAEGAPTAELVAPPSVVWNAVVAELRLGDDGAVDIDHRSPPVEVPAGTDSSSDEVGPDEVDPDEVDSGEGDASDEIGDEHEANEVDGVDPGSSGGQVELVEDLDQMVGDDQDETDSANDSMEALRADAVLTDLDRPIWQNPAAVILALIILALLIAIIF